MPGKCVYPEKVLNKDCSVNFWYVLTDVYLYFTGHVFLSMFFRTQITLLGPLFSLFNSYVKVH